MGTTVRLDVSGSKVRVAAFSLQTYQVLLLFVEECCIHQLAELATVVQNSSLCLQVFFSKFCKNTRTLSLHVIKDPVPNIASTFSRKAHAKYKRVRTSNNHVTYPGVT